MSSAANTKLSPRTQPFGTVGSALLSMEHMTTFEPDLTWTGSIPKRRKRPRASSDPAAADD